MCNVQVPLKGSYDKNENQYCASTEAPCGSMWAEVCETPLNSCLSKAVPKDSQRKKVVFQTCGFNM